MIYDNCALEKGGIIINSNEICQTYTAKEIQQKLQLGKTAAYNLCKSGKFKIIKIGKRSLRIDKKSFDQWYAKASKSGNSEDRVPYSE